MKAVIVGQRAVMFKELNQCVTWSYVIFKALQLSKITFPEYLSVPQIFGCSLCGRFEKTRNEWLKFVFFKLKAKFQIQGEMWESDEEQGLFMISTYA